MPFLFSQKKKSVVIAHPSRKDHYLLVKASQPYLDLDVMTLEEMRSLFDYGYDNRALRFLLVEGYRYPIAKDLLAAFVAPHFDKGEEVLKYSALRSELIDKGLLYKMPHPERLFIGAHILISGYYGETKIISDYLGSLSGKMEIDFEIEEKDPYLKKTVATFTDPYEELHYVFNRIAYDIDVNKTPLSDIYVYGLTSDYVSLVKEFSKVYGFAIDLENRIRLFDKKIYKDFKAAFISSGLESAIAEMRKTHPFEKDADTIEKFVREFALVFPTSAENTIRIYDDIAKETPSYQTKLTNVIHVLDEPVAPIGGHLYCLNFSMGTYPRVASESGLFNDQEKARIGLPTSKERALWDAERIDVLLRNKSTCSITYFEEGFDTQHFLSGFAEKRKLERIENPIASDENGPYEYAHDSGSFLYAALEDDYLNYLREDQRRSVYKQLSGVSAYPTYDPTFKGRKEGRNAKRSYSASSLGNYRSCHFRYLLDNILYLDDSEPQFSARIGNVIHKTLELYHDDPAFEFEKGYSAAIAMEEGLLIDPKANPHEKKEPFSPKEKAIIENLRPYCEKSLEFQKNYESHLQKASFLAEDKFEVTLDECGIKVTGRYDKIAKFEYHSAEHCFIIDYKTGPTKFDESLFRKYGLSLQLPLYAFAVSRDKSLFKDTKIAGLFIAPVLNYSLTNSEGKPIDDSDRSGLRLSGLYLNDPGLAFYVEPSMGQHSGIFASCSYSEKKGAFYKSGTSAYANFKDDGEFDEIARLAEGFIIDSDKEITDGNFSISPLKVKGHVDACQYCPFHDVCYVDKRRIAREIITPRGEDGEEEGALYREEE